MTISTKEQFSALSQAGRLGNYLRSWGSINDVEPNRSNYRGWLTIRSRDKASPHFLPWVTCGILSTDSMDYMDIWQGLNHLRAAGADPASLYFQEVPPPSATRRIQFEAMRGPQWPGDAVGLQLFFETNTTEPLRGIRERCKTATGAVADRILRHSIDADSYACLNPRTAEALARKGLITYELHGGLYRAEVALRRVHMA